MAVEIEHKFLVKKETWKNAVASESAILQGYLSTGSGLTVRVRLKGSRGFLTVKGPSRGTLRNEFEYEIPAEDARELLALEGVSGVISKTRYQVRIGSHVWDVDVFSGDNAGLVLAEVELSEEGEVFERPDWIGEEVTEDPRYFNSALAEKPYRSW